MLHIVYQVQLDDGRIWRRYVDDVFQNDLSSKPAEPAMPSPVDRVSQKSPLILHQVTHPSLVLQFRMCRAGRNHHMYPLSLPLGGGRHAFPNSNRLIKKIWHNLRNFDWYSQTQYLRTHKDYRCLIHVIFLFPCCFTTNLKWRVLWFIT